MSEESTEEKILAAAEEIFIDLGYDGARMSLIAEKAGINKALLHYYFRTKDKLFEMVLSSKIANFLPSVLQSIEEHHTFYDKVEVLVDKYLALLNRNPHIPIFVLFSLHRNPASIKHVPRSYFKQFIAYLHEAVDRKEIRPVDPEHLIVSILGMCVFPFVARPIASHLLGKNKKAYRQFLQCRKEQIMIFVEGLILKK